MIHGVAARLSGGIRERDPVTTVTWVEGCTPPSDTRQPGQKPWLLKNPTCAQLRCDPYGAFGVRVHGSVMTGPSGPPDGSGAHRELTRDFGVVIPETK